MRTECKAWIREATEFFYEVSPTGSGAPWFYTTRFHYDSEPMEPFNVQAYCADFIRTDSATGIVTRERWCTLHSNRLGRFPCNGQTSKVDAVAREMALENQLELCSDTSYGYISSAERWILFRNCCRPFGKGWHCRHCNKVWPFDLDASWHLVAPAG